MNLSRALLARARGPIKGPLAFAITVFLIAVLWVAQPFSALAIPLDRQIMPALSASDHGKTIPLTVGSTVELRLPDNPSTGYRWTFKADPTMVHIKEGRYTQSSELVGSGGEMQWFLQALKPGTTAVLFKRWREWEGEQSAIESFQLTLSISASP